MEFRVRIESIRQLVQVSGVSYGDLAAEMGLSQTMTSFKFKGTRPIFMDEVAAIVKGINAGGRMTVTRDQVTKLIGKKNLKVRGYAG